MSKPEWGTKRACQSCGSRFYDLLRSPIICPKCGAEFDPLANLRPRRGRAAAAEAKERREREVVVPDEVEAVVPDDELADPVEADAEDEDVIEDASELGEDDVPEVIEGEDEDER